MEEILKFEFFLTRMHQDLTKGGPALQLPQFEATERVSAQILAYVGDAVYSLHLRCTMLAIESNKIQLLHTMMAQMASAPFQAQALRLIEEELTDKEKAVVRRGRNTKSRVPRNSSISEYRSSTGLEALLGYLYLDRQYDRLDDILRKVETAVFQKLTMKNRGESP